MYPYTFEYKVEVFVKQNGKILFRADNCTLDDGEIDIFYRQQLENFLENDSQVKLNSVVISGDLLKITLNSVIDFQSDPVEEEYYTDFILEPDMHGVPDVLLDNQYYQVRGDIIEAYPVE